MGVMSAGDAPLRVVPGQPPTTPSVSRQAFVPRTRLLRRLTQDTTPVVAISAPAGAGKSTLVRQWAEQDDRPHVLLVAGPSVDDPAALAELLLDGLGRVGPPVVEARSVATGQEPDLSAGLLPALTSLAGSRDRAYVLVLDDVHLLEDPACHAIVRAVCDGVPHGSQVALISRRRPPTWLAQARARGRLLELHPEDLAFDADEVAELLREHGLTATPQEASELARRTDGWAVGLYLTVLSARERGLGAVGSPPRIDRSADYIADYLTSEVLGTLDEDTAAFLRRTSVLDWLSPALCDALLDRTDSAGRLALLRASLQLVIPVDGDDSRLRYHHLLQAALRQQLDEREPELVSELHRRAAEWLAEQDEVGEAVRHAKAAGDLPLAGELIMASIEACAGTGRPDLLRQWLSGLDDAKLATDRNLALAAAWAAMQVGDADRMTHWLLTCEAFAGSGWLQRAASDHYLAQLAAIHLVVGAGGLDGILTASAAVEQGLPADRGLQAAAAFLKGVALTLREDGRAQESLLRAEQLGRALDVPIIVADSLSWRGMLAILQGDRERGADLIAEAGDLIHDHHLERVAYAAHCVTAQCLVLALRGPRDRALATLAEARRMSALTTAIAPWFAVCGPIVQARAAALLGEIPTARALLGDARAHLTPDLTGTMCTDLLVAAERDLRTVAVDGVPADVLTPAELRVLHYLPSHLTFRQIGEHLFLSQNTVKTHALAVYRKLHVSSRDEAVTRAQTLGLLPLPPRT